LMAKKPMLKGPAAGAVARSTLRACVWWTADCTTLFGIDPFHYLIFDNFK
jgi:hypothetical protein